MNPHVPPPPPPPPPGDATGYTYTLVCPGIYTHPQSDVTSYKLPVFQLAIILYIQAQFKFTFQCIIAVN